MRGHGAMPLTPLARRPPPQGRGTKPPDRHFGDEDRRRVDAAAELEVGARLERREHVDQVRGDGDFGDRLGDLAAADHEADRAAAVIAGDAVHALPDQLDDQHRFGKGREQFLAAALPGCHVEIARDWRAGAPPAPRAAWPVGAMPSCRADALSAIQLLSTPPETSSCRDTRTPSPSNGRERRPRAPQRIVDDRHAGAEHCGAELVLQEAGLARDRRAADRAGEMAEQGRRKRADRTAPDICRAWAAPASSRATARSPARRPISAAASRSSRWRALCHAWSRCMVGALARDHARRSSRGRSVR